MLHWFRARPVRHGIAILIALYAANILVFAVLYWLAWNYSPDYFIVNQEVNLFPIQDLRAMWSSDISAPPPSNQSDSLVGLDSLYLISEEHIDRLRDLSANITRLEAEWTLRKEELDEAIEILSQSAHESFDRYFEESMQDLLEQEEEFTSQIEGIESLITESDDTQYAAIMRVKASELSVDLASLRVDIATRRSELLQEYITEYEKFLDPVALEQYEKASNLEKETQDQLFATRDELHQLNGDIYESFVSAYAGRVGRLNFVDFFYYSLTVSTANTFGDILPNHWAVRLLVIAQLVIDILLLGILVTMIADWIRGK